MYVKYGDFAFQPWEAGLSVIAEFERSEMNMKHMQKVAYHISGELCEEGEDDINTRLAAMIAAFSVDDKDCGLYKSTDATTVHFLSSSIPENITGNFVYNKKFPPTVDGEFVSGRKFELSVGAYLLDPEYEILAHHDTLHRVSNAGPQYEWLRDEYWGWFYKLVSPSTMQVIRHSGYRIGANTWPLPVTPFYSPPFEANHERRVYFEAPRIFKKGYTGFKTTWDYTYTLPTFDDISFPTLA
jgi:hypothetical protein